MSRDGIKQAANFFVSLLFVLSIVIALSALFWIYALPE
jgi:hypothetical protein